MAPASGSLSIGDCTVAHEGTGSTGTIGHEVARNPSAVPGRRHPPGSLGTVGLLEVQGATATVSLVKLTGER